MVNNINNFGVINFYENKHSDPHTTSQHAEDIQPGASSRQTGGAASAEEGILDISDSIIFTKKAKLENKIPTIIDALQKSTIGRKDKTRALVQELQSWQKDGYVDAHYNARVMYDELNKITPLAFEYDTFRKYYNNLI